MRIGESAAVSLLAASFPLLFTLLLLQFSFTNTTFGFLLVVALMGIVYAATIIFFGKYFKKGPYGTLLLIARSFRKEGKQQA
jgi:hypothetical protein